MSNKHIIILIIITLTMIITACSGQTATSPTVDPFEAVARAERTAAAAQDQADFYSRQLTATAEAPIVAITQTAAAFQMQQMFASATAASISATETAVVTQTAMAWTPTPNATSTMVAAQVAAEATQIANETRLSDLAVERARITNMVRAISVYVIGFVVLVAGLVWSIGLARKYSVYAVPTNEHGDKAAIVLDGVVMDPDRLPNGVGELTKSYVRSLPTVTAERQDIVTSHDQMIDLKSRTRVTNGAIEKLLKSQGLGNALPAPTTNQLAAPAVSEDDINLPLPPWEFIRDWDGTSKPLGFGRKGLITAKAASPHILISGKTGSGKTIYMMRTLTATSLAKGSQVVNIGYSNAGYGVFERHVNFHNVQLPDPRYVIECLAQVYDELKERKAMIGGDMVEWEYWPGGQPPRPFLDVMLDELGNMAEDIYIDHGPSLTKELWSYIARIANEGRKVGIRFVAALQDPTAKSMDLRFRRNCTLVAFRQGDRAQSDAFIGSAGAEQLSIGHFMARTDSLVIGGGFSPTDAEIMDYLAKSPVRPAEKPKWIEGVTRPVDGNQLPVREEPLQIIEPTQAESLPAKPVDEIAEMAERIRSQWSPTMSKSDVSRLFGKEFAGTTWTAKVNRVIAYLTATTPTPTENQPEIGILTPEMA